MRKLQLKLWLFTLLLVVGGVSPAWAQISTWTSAAGTYTSGQEFTGSTAGVVTMTLGTDDGWVYDSGRKALVTRTSQSPTFTDGLPTAGGYVKITPTRTLNFKMTTYSSQSNCNVYMIEESNPSTIIKDFRQKAYCENDYGTLEAGKTYYIYGGSFKTAGTSDNLEYVFYQKFTATTIENYTIKYVDTNGTKIADDKNYTGLFGATVTASEDDLASIEYDNKTYAYKSGNNGITLTADAESNVITLVYDVATIVNYTIKYVNDSEPAVEIKDAVVIESYVGASVTAEDEQVPTYITYNNVKYKYSTGNTVFSVTGNAETDVITLVYTPAPIYSYTVKALDGSANEIATIATGNYVEGDDAVTVPYSQYILSGTKLLNIANNGTGDYYRTTFTPDANDYLVNLTYNNGTINNVVFFTEGENVSGVSKGTNTARASNGQMGYTGNENTYKDVTTIEPGKYVIYYRALNGNSASRTANFKVGDNVVCTATITTSTNFTGHSDEFVVTESSTLSYACTGSSASGIDWFYLVKTGEVNILDITDFYLTNNSFETGDLTGWTTSGTSSDTGVKENSNSTYTTVGVDGSYLFNTWWQGVALQQTVSDLPAGSYKLSALIASSDANADAKIFLTANNNRQLFTRPAGTSGTFADCSMDFTLSEAGNVSIGAIGGNDAGEYVEGGHWWYKADNFRLALVLEGDATIPAAIVAKLEEVNPVSEGTVSTVAVAAYTAAKTAFESNATFDNYEAYLAAVANYNQSVANYAAIEAGTVATNTADGWAISTKNGTLACNTWSTEGNSDGSGMTTPFVQDWVGQGTPLAGGEAGGKLYYRMLLNPGESYTVSARVRAFNEAGTGVTGATFYVNDKTKSIDDLGAACTGDFAAKGKFGVFSCTAEVGEDGVLEFGIALDAASPINWVSIKDVTIVASSGVVPTAIELSQSAATLTTGDAVTLTATITPNDAEDQTILWTSSNEAVATVSGGIVTAVGAGTATITAQAVGGDNITATCTITVTDAPALAYNTAISGTGKYLLRNVATGKYLNAANAWGTQASLADHGVLFTATLDDGAYKLTDFVTSSTGLGADAYLDQTPVDVTVAAVNGKTNVYTLSLAEGTYLAGQAGSTVVTKDATDATSSLAQWQFISEDDMKKNMATASAENPIDMTYFIMDPNFSRNNGYLNSWTMVANNQNLGGGDNTNLVAESWHSSNGFTLSQTLTVPNGTYRLRAQAAGNGTPANVFVYANDETTPFNTISNGENSMAAMSKSFTNGLYYTEWVEVTVTDHTLTVGAKTTQTDSWCVFDNFQLEMIGYVPVTEIAATIDKTEIEAGETATISSVAVIPATASFTGYTFSSNNEAVATVSSEGVVTGIAAGEATITVKAEMDNVTKTFDVTVLAPAVIPTDITLAVGGETVTDLTVFINKTATITATVGPDGANQAVTFASSDENVVTVSAEGLVTPVAYGTANITVTSSAKAEVTAVLPVTVTAPLYSEAENLDFAEGPEATTNVVTYDKDKGTGKARMQEVTGWTIVSNGDARAAAVFAYNSGLGLGNASNVVPTAGPEGTNGYALGIEAVWNAALQYTQPVRLPAGAYTITLPIYNQAGTAELEKNLIGFVEDGGTEHFANTKSYAVGSWTTETITFVLDSETFGKLSLGYDGKDVGNGSAPHLFIDRMTITYEPFASSADYAALQEAINAAESNTLGFDKDEYAPYSNVNALTVLAAAKAIDQSANNGMSVVTNATTALSDAKWTANTEDVDAVYNGSFAEVTPGANYPNGWTRTNGWGQMQSGLSGDYATAYYNQPGTLRYGDTGIYTMPLNENTVYELTVVFRSHEDNSNNAMNVSVLNEGSEGLARVNLGYNKSKTDWKTVKKLFRTGAAGNYVLKLENDGNTWMTGVSIVKAVASEVTISEDDTYTPEEKYANVTFKRSLVAGWNGLVLPFDMTVADVKSTFDASDVKDFISLSYTSGEGVTLGFYDCENTYPTIPAGYPFLLKVNTAGTSYTIDNVLLPASGLQNVTQTVATAGDGITAKYTMKGTYGPTDLTSVVFALIQGDKFYYHNTGKASSAKAFRAYFENESSEESLTRLAGFNFDETTGISEVKTAEQQASGYYDLQGRRMNKVTRKGLYIVNGKKTVVK